ncbi:hypothetical protein F2Q70_00000546 [Brassica cretica]|uniref:Isopenicillin N synthase-like Fe(2+) 2OG dioxygenase domain-containing protein n=1 Tax=Brassica cretica TaxID=69181 RepID=A0A8S9J0F2_BRACR|nr:hypothetical protein F2Q70_00000546 [Brassica cretica]
MEWLSERLGLRREALKEGLGGEAVEYLMKINYYPPCSDQDLVVGAPVHTDVGAITFLVANEVSGLQAFKDNHWIDTKCTTSGIIVIIGDQFRVRKIMNFKRLYWKCSYYKFNYSWTECLFKRAK